jgi:hypothetical protein
VGQLFQVRQGAIGFRIAQHGNVDAFVGEPQGVRREPVDVPTVENQRIAFELADKPAVAIRASLAVAQPVCRESPLQRFQTYQLAAEEACLRARSSTVDTSAPAAYGQAMLKGSLG